LDIFVILQVRGPDKETISGCLQTSDKRVTRKRDYFVYDKSSTEGKEQLPPEEVTGGIATRTLHEVFGIQLPLRFSILHSQKVNKRRVREQTWIFTAETPPTWSSSRITSGELPATTEETYGSSTATLHSVIRDPNLCEMRKNTRCYE
jgi:hypothetical protein